MQWGHRARLDRIGLDGCFAESGDVVKVVKGRKYPIGMLLVVYDHTAYCKYASNGFQAYGKDQIRFGGEGFRLETIASENVEIVATKDVPGDYYKDVKYIDTWNGVW